MNSHSDILDLRPRSVLRERMILSLLILSPVIAGVMAFPFSYVAHTHVALGMLLIPLTFFRAGPRGLRLIHLVCVLAFAIGAAVFHVRIFLYFALAFYLIILIESFFFRVHATMYFLIIFMSPFFTQVATILGFPIRLQISAIAGNMLNLAGIGVTVRGNAMDLGGSVFNVDDACMGLSMLSFALLAGVLTVANQCRRQNVSVTFPRLLIFFFLVFLLNSVSNIVRIIFLVMFRIPQEAALHDVVGIICLVSYVVLPLHFISRWFVRRFGHPVEERSSDPFRRRPFHLAIFSLLAVSLMFIGARMKSFRSDFRAADVSASFSSLMPQQLSNGVTKFSDENMLLYVKPIPEFFSGEHTPLICWEGSGYEFSGITEERVAGKPVYVGRMERAGECLYTAWWYHNGKTHTVSQVDWRWRMLVGEKRFCLVNLTAATDDLLQLQLKDVIEKQLLTIE